MNNCFWVFYNFSFKVLNRPFFSFEAITAHLSFCKNLYLFQHITLNMSILLIYWKQIFAVLILSEFGKFWPICQKSIPEKS